MHNSHCMCLVGINMSIKHGGRVDARVKGEWPIK